MLKRLAMATALAVMAIAPAVRAAAADLATIDDTGVFPESITSTRAGDLIIGSNGKGAVYRAKAGADKATLWLDPAKTGIVAALGVFADDRSNTLYVCSVSPGGAPRQPALSVLRTFDLRTGAAKASYPMPDPDKATCNDIDVDRKGDAYVTDTGNGRVLRLKKGAAALETWVQDDRLATIDGLALGGDGTLYVDTVRTNRLFKIPIGPDGAAGPVAELQPSMPLAGPDGMRALGANRFLLAENSVTAGRVSVVTVDGDKATLTVLKEAPGSTAITRVGGKVWINNAKFAYRGNGPMKDQSPEPFTEYAIPLP